ncbi:MAG: calcium/proton exchanger [Chloroflexi bacterium]|nr:MAG: calcium/proton exchanger [Chloroflexota bacterium]
MKYLYLLLVFVPLAIAAEFLHWNETVIFATSALGMIPLAAILGDATEELAVYAGPRAGGLINATLGNAAELIITIFALREGLLELVKASITGSILGNILLILGLSLFLGGLRNGIQTFGQRQAGISATMMTLSVIALGIPTLFGASIGQRNSGPVEQLSISVAFIMIVLYILSLLFSFISDREAVGPATPHAHHEARWSLPAAVALLLGATVFIAWLSEILVGAVEPVVEAVGVTEFFLGIIIVPLVGNVAEHIVGVQTAVKNRMDLSLAISLGSSMQIALFVAPLLVFLSPLLGHPMDLIFNTFELVSLGFAVLIAALIALDGESNWLEGAQLLAVYAIIALAFFFLPV